MKILGFEFSTSRREVGLWDSARPDQAPLVRVAPDHTRSTPALAMTQELLREAGWSRGDIDRIAVGLGPGSYTGIRLALALTQGWQLAFPEVSVVGLGSAELIAARAGIGPECPRVGVAFDAQREEVHVAILDAVPRQEIAWRLMSRMELRDIRSEANKWLGPDLPAALDWVIPTYPSAAELVVRAASVDRQATLQAEELEPVYLRATAFKRV